MRNMKFLNKILIIAAVLVFGTSCEHFELDLLDNPNAITEENASLNDLYNSIQGGFNGVYQGSQGNPGAMARMYQVTAFTYQAATTQTTYDGLWNNIYAQLFPDIEALLRIAEDKGFDIHAGTAKIMKAYALATMVDLFNNVPSSEAIQGTDVISPAADQGADIYGQANALLDEAITQLTGTSAAPPAYDNFYQGDATKWITFAKTLKMKMALNRRLTDPGGAASDFNAVLSGGDYIDEQGEDFQVNFGNQRTNPNSRHPFYNAHYELGDGPYLSTYYMWLLRADKLDANDQEIIDPRIRYYFYRKIEKSETADPTTFGCVLSALPNQDAAPAHWKSVDARLPYCIVKVGDGYSGRDHLNGSGTPPDGPTRTSHGLYPGGGQFDWNQFEDTRKNGTTGGKGEGIWPIMLSSFVDFMRAEAALTMGTGEDAKALMESGIRKSMAKVESFESLVAATMSTNDVDRFGNAQPVKEKYGMSEERIQAYVDEVNAIYDRASNDQERLAVVIKEYYIAAWGNGLEAYNMYRRTGYPDNMQPGIEAEVGEFPRSFFLPSTHITRNATATQKSLTDKVFWDDGSANVY